jgi:cysteine synthase
MKPLPKVAAPPPKRRPKVSVAAKKNGVLPVLALPDRVAPTILERISRRGGVKAGSEFTQDSRCFGKLSPVNSNEPS